MVSVGSVTTAAWGGAVACGVRLVLGTATPAPSLQHHSTISSYVI